ncbi:HTH domain-containing protein [Natronobacterium gregoryi]|uniref:Uncharacterized protein n=2 Tax=Natronobacterium gregoryi TaxID=44930 RepID=L0AJM4_NATGS|nr:HTH domain-containing protein [Natronobacterium gregoryi]AFZ73387.1 hypothetical protein Natgr_2209 [Natronobacterium gregoryi SP2]ELY68583.1 hypothetical protein C490_09198 [Natronobacterium gregoryi SP2]PLK19667.1 hypothetical protein CYV19_13680 [Natronobacterium gregoryi SP2]SFI73478.1 hypothetical protein SAMN05443661_104117 [Natronobacterium gregoryi]
MNRTQSSPTSVELWIRSFTPVSTGPTQERALEHIAVLEEQTALETNVCIWGKEIEQTDSDETRPVRIPQLERIERRLESFEDWARRRGRRLEPFFRRRRIESTITDETHEVWRPPTVALAEFDGEDLHHVAPCVDGDRTIDVFDRLETLAGDSNSMLWFDDDRQIDPETESNAVISEQSSRRSASFDSYLESPNPE